MTPVRPEPVVPWTQVKHSTTEPLHSSSIVELWLLFKVSKCAKIRNRSIKYHTCQDNNGKVINLQLDNTNESQEVSPFPAGDHKAHIKRRAQRHSKHKTEQKHKPVLALIISIKMLKKGCILKSYLIGGLYQDSKTL